MTDAEEFPYKFNPEEKVLCFHGPLLYEAKCLEAKLRDKDGSPAPHYLVHYNGWNKKWDDWVDETRILKWNDENLARQRTLAASQESKKKLEQPAVKPVEKKIRKEDGTAAASVSTSSRAARRKPRTDDTLEAESEAATRIEIRITIPENLKRLLVDDWDYVTRQKKLVTLPRTPTVEQILQKFKATQLEQHDNTSADVLDEVIDGLTLYFDRALSKLLLYRFERPQYADYSVDHPVFRASQVYGCEHLLRLFVKLPALLAHTTISEDSAGLLVAHLDSFLRFFDRNFTGNYENATPDYCRRASP
ncbi:hypothetical protein CAOG_02469 [Capsaspora owczarzaki ATCC 30864]|uniref:Chromo domain-containing protein n=1 Tax=Capsaspora owczarzaki (strain ATCC 30864) TaxID=595528 RepID=A0A0D2U885_CAPO3|nr:hypothetical protein CAOG_02469 [Capsaspora owczarzaki ATCC 30864]KJE91316.1 hypothetical protein CAOG_002469 [Capsaspora owczarzaki ATCC 30864]|eukprot:XP_004349219.1 hypothetical protein CAOG_02469 [Capsaspora owczarzaki ATCC 30864]